MRLTLVGRPPRAPAQTGWGSALSFDGTNQWVTAAGMDLRSHPFDD